MLYVIDAPTPRLAIVRNPIILTYNEYKPLASSPKYLTTKLLVTTASPKSIILNIIPTVMLVIALFLFILFLFSIYISRLSFIIRHIINYFVKYQYFSI